MSKIQELEKTRSLLRQALNTAMASMPNNPSVCEAAAHIRTAIQVIDGVQEKTSKTKKMSQTQFQNWWGDVQSGVAIQPISAEASMKSLQQLNGMIAKEQSKIDEIESAAADVVSDVVVGTAQQLLQD